MIHFEHKSSYSFLLSKAQSFSHCLPLFSQDSLPWDQYQQRVQDQIRNTTSKELKKHTEINSPSIQREEYSVSEQLSGKIRRYAPTCLLISYFPLVGENLGGKLYLTLPLGPLRLKDSNCNFLALIFLY